jgi:hypothetical protein
MSNAPRSSVRRDVEILCPYYAQTAPCYETMPAPKCATDAFSQGTPGRSFNTPMNRPANRPNTIESHCSAFFLML